MKLKGIIDFSLGNFLCVRGFAPLGVLQDVSQPPADIQRIPNDARLKEIADYLRKGELLFFPEIILCACLDDDGNLADMANALFEKVKAGTVYKSGKFHAGVTVSTTVARSKGKDDIRAVKFFQVATVSAKGNPTELFARLDGNHRLKATNDQSVRGRETPFCLILCKTRRDFRKFSRALFHNINYKQVPLTMEDNLTLIIEDSDLFPDKTLQEDPSYGWPYYHTRRVFGALDFDLLPHIRPFMALAPRTFLLEQFKFLAERDVLGENEKAVNRFKEALVKVNATLDANEQLRSSRNGALLAALAYYQLKHPARVTSFSRWVLTNHLHLIERSNASDLIDIFNKILESRGRTIFVSMPYGKDKTEEHYAVIQQVVEVLNTSHQLKPPLALQRVDWFHDGTSYAITDKMLDMISDSGYLIGNLTYCNPNVYHEIGFIMGRAKALGIDAPNMLLFLDESIAQNADKFVGFNLRGLKHLRFTKTEQEFRPKLRTNIEKFYGLTPQA